MSDPYLSVVIPVFNEEENLPELLERLDRTLSPLGKPYEVIFVNDGSRDRSLDLLKEASARDPHLVVVDFNRNYGQHAAVFAGFEACRGEIVVTLDADLQNPPEEIPKLVAKMEEGFDVVGSVRVHRQDPLLRRMASKVINKMTAIATGVQLSDYGCMLRAYRRPVVKVLASSREISTFIPVLADLFAGRVTEVPVAHDERHHGASKYSVWKLIRLQFDLMTSFSVLPLRFTMGVGVVMSVLSMLLAVILIAGRLIWGQNWAVSGVFTLFALVFFFLGVQLFAIGLLGEYVGRIYQQVRGRPSFIVRQTIRGGVPSLGGEVQR
ncbi:MAG TPA: glycosyltransferase [Thermoanaerobaculia bacterium]|nr:glycosyltransferase [Thermoanaerobaculia bacterium]